MFYSKKISKHLFLISFLLFLWFLLHSIIIIKEGNNETPHKADLGVIFGTKNKKEGTLSKPMERRLRIGLRLYREGRVRKLLVTGGIGHKGFCEADLMQQFLLANKVPLQDIIIENEALNTEENVVNSLEIIKTHQFKNIIIVSQYFHIARIKLMFHKKQFYNLGSASSHHVNYSHHWLSLIREFFAYYYYLIFK